MAITKMVKCPRCKKLVMWEDKATCCNGCNLELIRQGTEVGNPFFDCGIVMDDTYETLLITKRKKQV